MGCAEKPASQRAKQRIIQKLGRKDALIASGKLEGLVASIGRYAERAIVLSQLHAGDLDGLSCKRFGAPLLFGRLWQDTGCRAVIDELLAVRGFEYPLESTVFASDLSVVLMDTTSLSFAGAGAATPGERGYSKDHCPDLMQMIVTW